MKRLLIALRPLLILALVVYLSLRFRDYFAVFLQG